LSYAGKEVTHSLWVRSVMRKSDDNGKTFAFPSKEDKY
jgi:hypothetical protein